MSKLRLRAGREAYAAIKKNGLTKDMISAVAAAAGGPKWFTTYGLVRYIIGDLLTGAEQHISFLGSSVGSWQMTAAMTSNPTEAIDRLHQAYCHTIYSDNPGPEEITTACKSFITQTIGDDLDFILQNEKRSLNVFAARGKGWLAHNSILSRGVGFGVSFTANAISRSWLDQFVERIAFGTSEKLPYLKNKDILRTVQVKLSRENLVPALQGSGCIPFAMSPIKDIPGAPAGAYWDGGLTDYHISLPYDVDGIVLHPHFLPDVTLGWFDKRMPNRRKATEEYMSKVLLVTPSDSHVNCLPRRQISDMKDFKFFGLDQEARVNYWKEISDRSMELGAELKELIESGEIMEAVEQY